MCDILKLYSFFIWIALKDIQKSGIPQWHSNIVEIICMFEKELPISFMDLQIHILIHLDDEVKLAIVVSHCVIFLNYIHFLFDFVCTIKKISPRMKFRRFWE